MNTPGFANFTNVNYKITRILFLLLFTTDIFSLRLKVPFFLKKSLCLVEDCDKFGSRFEHSLNKSVDPCNNFYQFSCDRWTSQSAKPQYEPIWNNWQSVSYAINNRIHQILNQDEFTKDKIFRKIKIFYTSCIDIKSMDDAYVDDLRYLVEELGSWPLEETSWTSEKFNSFHMIARITRLFGIHPILNINVNVDYKNTSKQIIYIQPGDLVLPYYILKEPRRYRPEMNAYKAWIYETVMYLYPTATKPNAKYDINRLVGLEVSLAKLMLRGKNERTTVEKLSRKFRMDWTEILRILFHETEIEIRLDDIVVVKNYQYLKAVLALIKKVNKRIIANYLMWSVVKDLSRETSQYMRNLNSAINQAILGTSKDLPRRHECLNRLKNVFSYALVPKYIDTFIHENTIDHVTNIANNIKDVFVKLLLDNTWLNTETKLMSIEKVKNIKPFIGYPHYIDGKTYIAEYFSNINISNHHFNNILRLKRFFSEQNLKQLRQTDFIRWPSNAFEVNGYYSILQNAIFIPMGLMEPPFFDSNKPEVFNYGAIGSLIGHEFTHSLDSIGRHANKDGSIKRWWKKEDITQYDEKMQCYENHYTQLNVDALLTSGENIADNIGLKLSYLAYKTLKTRPVSGHSSYLDEHTEDQLFFTSFAQMWCEISTNSDLFSLDEHAPTEKRVLGTLFNSDRFAKAFNCKNLNNQTKCEIW